MLTTRQNLTKKNNFQVRNTESARVSMPGQLSNTSTGLCAISDVAHEEQHSTEHVRNIYFSFSQIIRQQVASFRDPIICPE